LAQSTTVTSPTGLLPPALLLTVL
jgi:hypothetical protein